VQKGFETLEVYFRRDNPFHHVDSAYHYGLLAVESYDQVKERKQQKWNKKFHYTIDSAVAHRSQISAYFFAQALQDLTLESINTFLAKHPASSLKDSALFIRHVLAYEKALADSSSKALVSYLNKYPESHLQSEAKQALYEVQFEEEVSDDINSYQRFINKYPENPNVPEAEQRIYELSTAGNTIHEYEAFIANFPRNPYVADAWKKLYRKSIEAYTIEEILNFSERYPAFPFNEIIERDLQLTQKELFQFKKDNRIGFMDAVGNIVIQANYTNASNFSHGLAAVEVNDQFGYIDKTGQLVIPCAYDEVFDFSEGKAVVEKDGFLGLIDANGNYILKPIFDDIGPIREGLFYVEKDGLFHYFESGGTLAFKENFEEAFSFEDGMAKVKKEGVSGYILKDGSFFVKSSKGDVRRFNDTLFVLKLRDSSTFILPNGLLDSVYFDHIGMMKENRAIVSKQGKYGYVNRNAERVIEIELDVFDNYTQFAQFSNGHARAFRKGRFAMMDSLGRKVLPAIFTRIGEYGELIPITKGDGWGYTDEEVQLRIQYQYDFAYPFIDGLAIVELDQLVGLIDLKGEEIAPLEYEDLLRTEAGIFIFRKNGMFGLLDSKGKLMMEKTYQRIIERGDGLYRLENTDEIEYYDITKGEFISLKQ
jgi:outer membrane protein assembly factor BamD (BamD/ComL family)